MPHRVVKMRPPRDVVSLLIVLVLAQPLMAATNELNGKHLRIVPLQSSPYITIQRNSMGTITGVGGPGGKLLDSLSQCLNFSYEILQVNPSNVEDTKTVKGAMSYLTGDEADLIASALVMTNNRFKNMDTTHSWLFTQLNLLIPTPQPSDQIKAVVQPYSNQVWISLIIALISITLALWFLARLYKILNKEVTDPEEEFSDLNTTFSYVLALLLSQGGSVQSKKLFIRLAAGTWCLACFVLVNAYSSTLISYVTTPGHDPPVISSINDIPKVPKLHMCVLKGKGIDMNLSVFKSGLIADLKKDMDNHPETRCINMTSCIDLVSAGSCAYLDALIQLNMIIETDFIKTKECNFAIAKESVLYSNGGFGIQKNSPYKESLNKGVLRVMESGLMAKYESEYYKKPEKCIKDPNSSQPKRALSLKNLTGAFLVLGIGCFLSITAFIIERVVSRRRRR